MKNILFLILSFLFLRGSTQVPADSLVGTYVGEYYYASPPSNPWTIAPDTFWISNVDSVNCIIQANDLFINTGNHYYYTNYYSCNGTAPVNYYIKFYSSDSLKAIDDNVAQPMPNPPASRRFFGKRISGQVPLGINEAKIRDEELRIYPNPANNSLQVTLTGNNAAKELTFYDVLGNEVINTKEKDIDVSKLNEGIYFVQVKKADGVLTKKIIVQR